MISGRFRADPHKNYMAVSMKGSLWWCPHNKEGLFFGGLFLFLFGAFSVRPFVLAQDRKKERKKRRVRGEKAGP